VKGFFALSLNQRAPLTARFVHGGAANTMAWRRGGGSQSRMSAPIHVTPSRVSSPAACLLSTQKHSNPAFAHGRTMFPVRSHKLRTEPLLAFRSATVLRAQSGMSPLPIQRETVSRLTPKARASGAFQRARNMTSAERTNGSDSESVTLSSRFWETIASIFGLLRDETSRHCTGSLPAGARQALRVHAVDGPCGCGIASDDVLLLFRAGAFFGEDASSQRPCLRRRRFSGF